MTPPSETEPAAAARPRVRRLVAIAAGSLLVVLVLLQFVPYGHDHGGMHHRRERCACGAKKHSDEFMASLKVLY